MKNRLSKLKKDIERSERAIEIQEQKNHSYRYTLISSKTTLFFSPLILCNFIFMIYVFITLYLEKPENYIIETSVSK